MIVIGLQSFKLFETECIKSHLKASSITVNTLKKNMASLTKSVEENISQKLS